MYEIVLNVEKYFASHASQHVLVYVTQCYCVTVCEANVKHWLVTVRAESSEQLLSCPYNFCVLWKSTNTSRQHYPFSFLYSSQRLLEIINTITWTFQLKNENLMTLYVYITFKSHSYHNCHFVCLQRLKCHILRFFARKYKLLSTCILLFILPSLTWFCVYYILQCWSTESGQIPVRLSLFHWPGLYVTQVWCQTI